MSDIESLRAAWLDRQDGESGYHYGLALEAAGSIHEAAHVYTALIEAGYLIGYENLAWLEHDRGDIPRAQELLEKYLEIDSDPDESTARVSGVLGLWRWCYDGREDAEPLLRAGMDAHEPARSALAHVLMASDREEEAESLLRLGVDRGEVQSFLPLAGLLEERGDEEEAEQLLRYGFALGDGHSAYNLHLLLESQGRGDEAREWLWRAAESGDDKAIDVLAGL